jgi:hypothetical protein
LLSKKKKEKERKKNSNYFVFAISKTKSFYYLKCYNFRARVGEWKYLMQFMLAWLGVYQFIFVNMYKAGIKLREDQIISSLVFVVSFGR